jgi:hypothetical protein
LLLLATALSSRVCSSTASPTRSSPFHDMRPPAHIRRVYGAWALKVLSVPSGPSSCSSPAAVKYTKWWPGGTGVPSRGGVEVTSWLCSTGRLSVRDSFWSWFASSTWCWMRDLLWKVSSRPAAAADADAAGVEY